MNKEQSKPSHKDANYSKEKSKLNPIKLQNTKIFGPTQKNPLRTPDIDSQQPYSHPKLEKEFSDRQNLQHHNMQPCMNV